VKYPKRHIRIRGSVITWALHSELHDAFLIWVLAQDFNATPSNSNDGYHLTNRIKAKKAFLRYLVQTMDCTITTAKKRLNRAIKHRFLGDDGDSYLLIGHERLVDIAFRQQTMAYDSKRSFCDPSLFFEDDRRYTIEAGKLVDPTNLWNTKAFLYGIMAVYGSRYLWCRDTHAKIMRVNRRHTIRLTKKANIRSDEQHLCIDPMSLLHNPKCGRIEAIEAVQQAENLYRTGSKIRGRSLVQRRTIPNLDSDDFKTSLTLQLPNLYTCDSILREAPASTPKFMVDSLSRVGMTGDCAKPIPSSSENQNKGVKRKELPAGGRKFLDARGLRETRKLGDSFNARYLSTLGEILANDDCRESVLAATGASDILPLSYANPILHRGKIDRFRVTPSMLSDFVKET